eukprot:TRINITY_DN620_c0_g1_i1.p1 TRINITY_DN620_c0_g1~~TRINITY_DN620_c0_g1_i1.p1  ORF type:complete len:368 (+),score=96.33 TRINITY_DN620_c0_g1_i1:36-1139(+)
MAGDLSLAAFLKAARPEWKQTQLAAVEEKLESVGVHDVLGLVQALRGKSERSLNNRLKAVGEKCFTSDTLTAFRMRIRQEPILRRAAQQRAANARLAAAAAVGHDEEDDDESDEVLEHNGNATHDNATTASRKPKASPADVTPVSRSPDLNRSKVPSMAASKDDLLAALDELGFAVSPTCQARDMRAMLVEVNRCRSLSRADLLAEARGTLGLNAAAAASQKSETLVRRLVAIAFPNVLDDEGWATDAYSLPGSGSEDGEEVDEGDEEEEEEVEDEEVDEVGSQGSDDDDDDDDDDVKFEILTARPEPLSLSTLVSSSCDDLLQQCHARGLKVEGLEKRKGMLALLLKMESRREYLQSFQVAATVSS